MIIVFCFRYNIYLTFALHIVKSLIIMDVLFFEKTSQMLQNTFKILFPFEILIQYALTLIF